MSESSGIPVSHIVVIDQLVPNYGNNFLTELTLEELFCNLQGV